MAATECTQCVRVGLGETPTDPQINQKPNTMVQPISISQANTRCRFCKIFSYAGYDDNNPENQYAECTNPICNHNIDGLAIVASKHNFEREISCSSCKLAEYSNQLIMNFE